VVAERLVSSTCVRHRDEVAEPSGSEGAVRFEDPRVECGRYGERAVILSVVAEREFTCVGCRQYIEDHPTGWRKTDAGFRPVCGECYSPPGDSPAGPGFPSDGRMAWCANCNRTVEPEEAFPFGYLTAPSGKRYPVGICCSGAPDVLPVQRFVDDVD
jgi:hypothetical protein